MTSLSPTTQTAWIALGGNLGDVDATFAHALSLIDETPVLAVQRASAHYRTSPVGEHAGDPFVNAVAELSTSLAPLDLLDRLQAIETRLGRVRTVRWGPRTLDLDLLMFGDAVVDHPRLQVPHPACWYRRFVLDPWVEIGAEVVHPVKRLTIRALRERLLVRPMTVGLAGGEREVRNRLLHELVPEFPAVRWSIVDDVHVTEPTLTIALRQVDESLRERFAVSWLGIPTSESPLSAIREVVISATVN